MVECASREWKIFFSLKGGVKNLAHVYVSQYNATLPLLTEKLKAVGWWAT